MLYFRNFGSIKVVKYYIKFYICSSKHLDKIIPISTSIQLVEIEKYCLAILEPLYGLYGKLTYN